MRIDYGERSEEMKAISECEYFVHINQTLGVNSYYWSITIPKEIGIDSTILTFYRRDIHKLKNNFFLSWVFNKIKKLD